MLLLKSLLFTVFVPGSVAVWLPLWILGDAPVATGPLAWLALLAFALGGATYAWCVWDFAVHGRATPAPIDAPKTLVARGLYRVVRNPMYVGVLGVIAGWAARHASWRMALYGLGVATIFQLFIVLYEEPHLRKLFGTTYADYCARVGRWWPRGTAVQSSSPPCGVQ